MNTNSRTITSTGNKLNDQRTTLIKFKSYIIKIRKLLTSKTVLVEIISAFFILLFIYTGLHKLMDINKFRSEMIRSPFIQEFAGFIVYAIPIGELLLSLLLIIKKTRLLGLYLSFTLMSIFTGYVWIMINYAFDLPCSCGGIVASLSWNEHLIFNSAFSILGIVAIFLQTRINHRNA